MWPLFLAAGAIASTVLVDLIEAAAASLAKRNELNLPGWV